MLRKTPYAALILILTIGTAFAQSDKPGLSGYNSLLRSNQEKNDDREIDRAYRSTIKRAPDAEKKKSDPWADVRQQPPTAAKNK